MKKKVIILILVFVIIGISFVIWFLLKNYYIQTENSNRFDLNNANTSSGVIEGRMKGFSDVGGATYSHKEPLVVVPNSMFHNWFFNLPPNNSADPYDTSRILMESSIKPPVNFITPDSNGYFKLTLDEGNFVLCYLLPTGIKEDIWDINYCISFYLKKGQVLQIDYSTTGGPYDPIISCIKNGSCKRIKLEELTPS